MYKFKTCNKKLIKSFWFFRWLHLNWFSLLLWEYSYLAVNVLINLFVWLELLSYLLLVSLMFFESFISESCFSTISSPNQSWELLSRTRFVLQGAIYCALISVHIRKFSIIGEIYSMLGYSKISLCLKE